MEKSENTIYKILSAVLAITIVVLIIFVIIPKFSPTISNNNSEQIDFSSSAWIEQYMEDIVGIYGKDFFQSSAFSYNLRSNKMIVTYASQKSIEEARDYYLSLPAAEQIGRNDETSLNLTAVIEGQLLKVYNYYSSVSRVFELDLTLNPDKAAQVISQLEIAFPGDEMASISEIEDIISGEIFGGYVRYRYDDFDDFFYPFIPIFSRAFVFEGTEEEFNGTIDLLNEAYSNYKFDETQNAYYYKINRQIVSISFFVTDLNEKIISISIQEEKALE